MSGLFDWLLQLPQTFGNVLDWLQTEVTIGNFSFTPFSALGASLGVFLAVIVGLKIKSLILA